MNMKKNIRQGPKHELPEEGETSQKPEVLHENDKVPRLGRWPSRKITSHMIMSIGCKQDRLE